MRPWFRDRFLRSASLLSDMPHPATYEDWTKEELILRLRQLEITRSDSHTTPPKSKPFDFTSHPKRKIALKFCYSGWAHNGLAFQSGPTPLPTVEDTLFKALVRTRLVDPAAGFEGCGWEKCGRTDRGVSAAGQVVSLWIRSAIQGGSASSPDNHTWPDPPDAQPKTPDAPFRRGPPPERRPEIRYVSVLNRVLPATIRVLAWSPVAPSFSARFACRHRHYKYFFTPHDLDVARMREGAARLLGEHDFRNFCKLDPAKQITNFRRTILRADIERADPARDDVYVFNLVGTAFLYHQVRHIMAILFLVGTGLEYPSVVSALLTTSPRADSAVEAVDSKPEYQMADGLPLMLWDCAYADSDTQWTVDGDGDGLGAAGSVVQAGAGAELYRQVHSIHTHSTIHAALDAHFLSAVARHHPAPVPQFPSSRRDSSLAAGGAEGVMCIPLGAGTFKRTGKYVPLLRRNRLERVEVTNERWLLRKGGKKDVVADENRDGGDE